MRGGKLDDALGGADVVGLAEHLLRALGVREHRRVGMRELEGLHLRTVNHHVARAVALVEDDVLVGQLLGHVAAEVLVGDEQQVALRQLAADLDSVGRGHADVAPGLDPGGGVDVAHHGEVVAVLGARGVDVGLADHVRHRAVGGRLGEQHALGGVQQLDALAHELHAAEHDGLLRQVDGHARQGEGVAHVVGDGLDLGRHVVVGEDHGVLLALEALNLGADVVGHGGAGCGGLSRNTSLTCGFAQRLGHRHGTSPNVARRSGSASCEAASCAARASGCGALARGLGAGPPVGQTVWHR